MASALDPYSDTEVAQFSVPKIPGIDAPLSAAPSLAAHQQAQQGYAANAMALQQQQLATQTAHERNAVANELQAYPSQPDFKGKGWSDLTPDQQKQVTGNHSPIVVPEIPGLYNQAQSVAAGRPVGINVREGEIVSAKGPEGSNFQQIQPTVQGGAQTDENGNPLPSNKDSIIQGVVSGQFPSSMLTVLARKNPQLYAGILGEIHKQNPDWTPQLYQAQEKARESFNGNAKNAQSIQSSNLFAQHAGQAFDLIDAMHNSGAPGWNAVANKVGDLTGTQNSTARNQFSTAAHTMATEYAKALSGGVPNEGEIKNFERLLDPALGPATLKANIQQMAHAVNARLDNLKNEWDRTVGMPRNDGQFLSPDAQSTLQRIGAGQAAGAQGPTGAPQLSAQDQQALQWAAAHPQDPRAVRIRQLHGQ